MSIAARRSSATRSRDPMSCSLLSQFLLAREPRAEYKTPSTEAVMNLEKLRQRLDQVDSELLELAKERQDIVGQIGAVKIAQGVPTRDYEREREVLKSA